jgi:pimeloyl-ACP methyl ester carboxylesterase
MSVSLKKSRLALNYTDSGTGDIALVFLHYFGGSSRTWSYVLNELNGQFRCIAIDLCGFGDSPSSCKGLSVSDNAQSVFDVITILKLKKYVLIGHSMGGKIALLLASHKPFGLEKLVLIAPSPPTPEPTTDMEREQLLVSYNNRSLLIKTINSITSQPLTNLNINSLVNDNLRASESSWKSWIEHGSQEDISFKMPCINIPVLVISGQDDKKLSSGYLYSEFVKYLRFVDFEEIKKAGHLLPIEAPLAIAELIREAVEQKDNAP